MLHDFYIVENAGGVKGYQHYCRENFGLDLPTVPWLTRCGGQRRRGRASMTKRELWPRNAVVIHEIGTRSLAVGSLVWPPFISVPFEKADRDRPRPANTKA